VEVVVEAGVVDVVVDDGRVVVVGWPEPPPDREDGRVVLVVESSGPVVVVVEVEVVAPPSGAAGAVVEVVEEESVVVVAVVVSDAGAVVEVVSSVVEVVSAPVPGSGLPTSARAWAAERLTRATNMVVRARARRTRLNNTRISSPGFGGVPRKDGGSNGITVEHIGRRGRSSPNGMFQTDDGADGVAEELGPPVGASVRSVSSSP
jgi:hypothetical protein